MHREEQSHVCRSGIHTRALTMHVHPSASTAPERPALQPYCNVMGLWRLFLLAEEECHGVEPCSICAKFILVIYVMGIITSMSRYTLRD